MKFTGGAGNSPEEREIHRRCGKITTGWVCSSQVPVFVVVTKTDVCSAHVMEQTVQALFKLLKRPGECPASQTNSPLLR